MKTLVTFLLLLTFSAFGAVPDYRAFRGTGGIIIVTNPPNGTIIIDGSAISSTNNNTPGGGATSIQYNSNSMFAGNNNLQYFAVEWFGESFGPAWAINNGSATNILDPYGMTSLGTDGLYFRTEGTDIKWNLTGTGNWVPWLSNAYNMGSWALPASTNWVNDAVVNENLAVKGFVMGLSPTMTRAIGDSITAGSGVAALTNSYVSIIASNTSWTITNAGISSREMPTLAYAALNILVGTNDAATLLTGFNDMRHWGTAGAGLRTYEESLRAALVHLAIPEANKHWISTGAVMNARFSKTGTWEHHNLFYPPLRYTTYGETVGGTISCVMYGSAIYVGFTDRSSLGAPAGNFTITVDGVLQTTVYPTNNGQSAEGESYWPGVARVSDLSDGAHTVLLTITGGVCLDWVASNDGINPSRTPRVYSAGCLPARTNAYALGTPYNNGSDEAARVFRRIHDNVVSELAADGLGVIGVDAYRYFSPNADQLNADQIHPNELGHRNIARAFMDIIHGLPTVTDRQGSRYANELGGLLFPDKKMIGLGTTTPTANLHISNVVGYAVSDLLRVGNGSSDIVVRSNGVLELISPGLVNLKMAYDTDTYMTVSVGSGGLASFTTEDSGTGDAFAFVQTVDVAYAANNPTTFDLMRAINTSTTSGAAAGIWGIVGGQNVGGIAFIHNGVTGDSGSTALHYGNGAGLVEGLRLNQLGNVGIGTTVPASSLDVTGGVRAITGIFTNSVDISGAAGNLGIAGNARLKSTASGVITLWNDGQTDYTGLGFGGTGASAPLIARAAAGSGHLKMANGPVNLTTATNAFWFQGQHASTGATNGTINQQSGKVRMAAGNNTYWVTNSLVTASSIVLATLNTSSAVTEVNVLNAIPTAGLLQLRVDVNSLVDCDISWFIVSP